jgi:uncharacterized protein
MISPVASWRQQKSLFQSIGQTGTIISWTIIHVAPLNFTDQTPYPVVLVRLSNGSQLTSQLVDYDSAHLHAGQKVIVVVRKTFQPAPTEIIPYSLKFKPV